MSKRNLPNIEKPKISAQRFLNGEVHNWYRSVHGFSDHLVGYLLDKFGIEPGKSVLDPFCGTGTTLVECMKRGINSLGIDSNPSSCFSSRTKTTWNLKRSRLLALLEELQTTYKIHLNKSYNEDPTFKYLDNSGMIRRGWISNQPLKKAIAIKIAIKNLPTSVHYKNIMMLALLSEIIYNSSNVKFGPEIYCATPKINSAVFKGFSKKVQQIAEDLEIVSTIKSAKSHVLMGDSRYANLLIKESAHPLFSAVITSPPYPAEHDYTRNSRLELAFLEKVTDRDTLRAIKKNMIRSHTKGIYKEDSDGVLVEDNVDIQKITSRLNRRIKKKTHGFARLYPKVIREYFGGMQLHLESTSQILEPGAKCAYVLGDQSCYLQVHIPTAAILSSIAEKSGFKVLGIEHWRQRWSSKTSKIINENILILQKP